MKIARHLFARLIIISICLVTTAFAQPKADDAVKAAETWLKLVDSGRYRESWAQAAAIFRIDKLRMDWQIRASRLRGPLGHFKTRKLVDTYFFETFPKLPKGEYFLLTFESNFLHEAKEMETDAIESIMTIKEANGVWRVVCYYLK